MSSTSFRRTHLPYGITQNADGTFTIFKRHYQVLGGPLTGLRPGDLDRLAHTARITPTDSSWFLYDDGCIPDASKENRRAYTARLRRLRKLRSLR